MCRRLRQWTDAPITELTAEGAESHKVDALDEGADDHVTKPFATPELLARAHVAVRHRRRGDPETTRPWWWATSRLPAVPEWAETLRPYET